MARLQDNLPRRRGGSGCGPANGPNRSRTSDGVTIGAVPRLQDNQTQVPLKGGGGDGKSPMIRLPGGNLPRSHVHDRGGTDDSNPRGEILVYNTRINYDPTRIDISEDRYLNPDGQRS